MNNKLASFFTRTTLISVTGLAILVLTTIWAAQRTSSRVDQAIRQNFGAAGLLAQLQVEGERMRRFEKEMFIYVAAPDKRAGYIKEYRESYDKALGLLDTMLAPSGRLFSDAERQQITSWKLASVFYYGEFDRLARQTDGLNPAALTPDQRAGLTVQFNDGIKAGKDRFRELLTGTAKMRAAKEAQSNAIAGEIDSVFSQMVRLVALVALALAVGIAITSRQQPRMPGFRSTRSASNSTLGPRSALPEGEAAARGL